MSSNRLNNTKKKFQDFIKKDLTPKSSQNSPKVSPLYSSFRTGLTIKPQLTPKSKILRPQTSKNSSHSENYFAKREDKKTNFNSTKKISKIQSSSRPLNTTQYEYQPRAKSRSPAKQNQQIIKQELDIKYPTNVNMSREMQIYINQRPQLPKILSQISNFQKAKISSKQNGLIKAFSASTNVGPVRQHNQDRVAIILTKPQHCQQWKKCAYFGVFDGHGGVDCAEFLRDNLHIYIARQKNFPEDMENSIKLGFQKCEKTFIDFSKNGKLDRSGSCAIVTFFNGNMLHVANVGDSRAIMSSKYGQIISELSIDHKASSQYQQKRIMDVGGKIYQTQLRYADPNSKIFYEGQYHEYVIGPHRVMPGRLSTTRTFGDIQAKLPQFKGNPKAIIHEPEIMSLKISGEEDFVLIGSDGIFDKVTNSEIIQLVWDTFRRDQGKYKSIHQFCGLAVQNVMKLAFHKKTADNITVVLIALQGLERYFTQKQVKTLSYNNSINGKTSTSINNRKGKIISRYDPDFERRYLGRSMSPSSYSSLRSHSFNRN